MERIPVPQPAAEAAPAPDPTDPADATTGTDAVEPLMARIEQRLDRLIADRLERAENQRHQEHRQALTERFAATFPDFDNLRETGALAAIRADNPLLDDVAAYLTHRLAAERQEHASALEQARREATTKAETDLLEKLRTKRLAGTLASSAAATGRGQGQEPELGAPERFGGLTHVLASRLDARRKGTGH